MTLLIGSLQLGFIYGILALGVYITFRILNVPDLTAEGSFTCGVAISAVLTMAGHPWLGMVLAAAGGAAAGICTGLLQTKAGIHPILSGILTMSGLYSINLLIMGSSSNLTLLGSDTAFQLLIDRLGMNKEAVRALLSLVLCAGCTAVLSWFFKTHTGLCIRATGDNEDMVRASSINVETTKILALAIGNGCIALSGGILAQYQGFADINSGVGILVVGLASVIIGEAIWGRRSVTIGLISAVIGSVIYRYIIAAALRTDIFPSYFLKLISACIVAIALSLPELKRRRELSAMKKRGKKHAGH